MIGMDSGIEVIAISVFVQRGALINNCHVYRPYPHRAKTPPSGACRSTPRADMDPPEAPPGARDREVLELGADDMTGLSCVCFPRCFPCRHPSVRASVRLSIRRDRL